MVDRSKQSHVVNKTALDKAREAPGSTKARILTAAEEVFASRGFPGASTREIAARKKVRENRTGLARALRGVAINRKKKRRLAKQTAASLSAQSLD